MLKALVVAGLLVGASVAQAQNRLPDGNGKEIVQKACTVCHGLGEIFRSGYQGDDWKRIVPLMVGYGAPVAGADMPVVIDYLAKNIVPQPKPEPVVVRGEVEAQVKEWKLPQAGSWPHDAYVTRDGRVWYTGQNTNKLGVFDPKTEQFKEYELKTPKSGPQSMVDDAEGNIWFTPADAKYIGKLDPKTGAITEYPLSDQTASHPHTPVLDGKGNLWATISGKSQIGRLNIRTGEMKIVSTRTSDANPYGIALNSQGVPFVTLFNTNKLARIDPVTMEVQEFTLPNPETRPRRLAVTPDDMIWYTDYARGYLGRFDPKTGETKEWPSPSGPDAGPYGITAVGNTLWYGETGTSKNAVVRFDPQTEKFQTWVIPSGKGVPRVMSYDQSGNVWFVQSHSNALAKVEVK
jgi:virginiamycin B lyase